MNRAELQQLSLDRVRDAGILLANGCWGAAYYLSGYAVECGLKSCILAFVERTGAIFLEKKFSEKCWTHDPTTLIQQADLTTAHSAQRASVSPFSTHWNTVASWSEASRYEQTSEQAARLLYEAITHDPHGVLKWLQNHW